MLTALSEPSGAGEHEASSRSQAVKKGQPGRRGRQGQDEEKRFTQLRETGGKRRAPSRPKNPLPHIYRLRESGA